LSDEFVENFGSIDNLGFTCIEHLSNLSSHEGFTGSRRSEEEDTYRAVERSAQFSFTGRVQSHLTLDVLDTEFLDESRREDSRGESSTKDCRELGIQSSDSHVFKFEVGSKDGIRRWSTQTIWCISYAYRTC
jgi:hypothetical protein